MIHDQGMQKDRPDSQKFQSQELFGSSLISPTSMSQASSNKSQSQENAFQSPFKKLKEGK